MSAVSFNRMGDGTEWQALSQIFSPFPSSLTAPTNRINDLNYNSWFNTLFYTQFLSMNKKGIQNEFLNNYKLKK